MQLILVSLTPCIDAHVSWPLPLPSLENLDWNRVAHRQTARLPFFASLSVGMIGRAPHCMELKPWPSPGIQCYRYVAVLQGPFQAGSEIRNYLCHVFFKHSPLSPNPSWLTLDFSYVRIFYFLSFLLICALGKSGHASSSLCGKGLK